MKTAAFLSAFLLGSVLLLSGQTNSTVSTQKSIKSEVPEQIRNSNQFKRAEYFYNQRAFPYDTIPLTRYYQEMDRELAKVKSGRLKSDDYPFWASVGPRGVQTPLVNWGTVSGRVRAIAVHPTDPQTVFIGAASGGLWMSNDGGASWGDFGYGLESQTFGAIAIDPKNPAIIYAGSGESMLFGNSGNFPGRGLFKSTNGGRSWIVITDGIGNQTHFSDLAVSPYNSDMVLAALGSGYAISGIELPNEGIWRSLDGGISWNRTLDLQDAFDIAFHPTDPDIVYAAVGGTKGTPGFFISNDQGATWVPSNSGLVLPTTGGRIQFDISQSNPDIIYAVIYDLNSPAKSLTRAYKSVNGGNSWAQISAGTDLGGCYGSDCGNQGGYDLCIAVDPVDPNHVLTGNIELHRTTNGSAFSPVRPFGSDVYGSLVHWDYHKLVYAPSNPDILYIGCDGGIYKSTDKGYTANSMNLGLKTLQFYRVASHPTNPRVIMGGMQDNSSAITTDGGSTWNRIFIGDGMECFFDRADPDNVLYGASYTGYLYKSVNGGASLSVIYSAYGAWITPFFMHPTDNKILYTANKKILKSTNAGSTFEVISGSTDVSPAKIGTMAQSQVNPNNMIFGTGIDVPLASIIVVKVSTDEGSHWTDVTSKIPGETRWVSRVVTDPVDASTMYVVKSGYSPGNKVYKTTDLGQSWTNISGDLPDLPCNDLFIDPENTRHLYVANDIGIYLSADGGTSWIYGSEGIPAVPVFDFDYVKIGSERYLRVGTYGRSVYQTLLPDFCLANGVTFSTQSDIDNYLANYPGCARIDGNVTISGSDIGNLDGLAEMSSIGGTLAIHDNPMLTSLEGLKNIDPGSITNLIIRDNDSLSTCEILPVCSCLASPGGTVEIQDNAPGCNSREEVEKACLTSSESMKLENQISIFPNPGKGLLVISAPGETVIEMVAIYNSAGQQVHQGKPANSTVDISKLRPGMYFIEIRAGKLTVRKKFVVE